MDIIVNGVILATAIPLISFLIILLSTFAGLIMTVLLIFIGYIIIALYKNGNIIK